MKTRNRAGKSASKKRRKMAELELRRMEGVAAAPVHVTSVDDRAARARWGLDGQEHAPSSEGR